MFIYLIFINCYLCKTACRKLTVFQFSVTLLDSKWSPSLFHNERDNNQNKRLIFCSQFLPPANNPFRFKIYETEMSKY